MAHPKHQSVLTLPSSALLQPAPALHAGDGESFAPNCWPRSFLECSRGSEWGLSTRWFLGVAAAELPLNVPWQCRRARARAGMCGTCHVVVSRSARISLGAGGGESHSCVHLL